jgi:hypothetical protein
MNFDEKLSKFLACREVLPVDTSWRQDMIEVLKNHLKNF